MIQRISMIGHASRSLIDIGRRARALFARVQIYQLCLVQHVKIILISNLKICLTINIQLKNYRNINKMNLLRFIISINFQIFFNIYFLL